MKWLTSSLAILFVGLVPGIAGAEPIVVFDTFGPGDSYATNAGYIIGVGDLGTEYERGIRFSPWTTVEITGIEAAVLHAKGVNAIDFHLRADESGQPGAILETFSFSGVAGSSGGEVLCGTSTVRPVVFVGTDYWLTASGPGAPDSWMGWFFADPHYPAVRALSSDGGPWEVTSSEKAAAFRVVGVPEPSTLVLLLSGSLGLLTVRRRRRGLGARTGVGP